MSADPARAAHRLLTLGALGALGALGGCEWFTDFKQQPKLDPWESVADSVPPRGQPQYSVPTTGTFVPGYAVSYQPLPATIDSMSGVANPTPPSAASLENGRKYYEINCAVCHGAAGRGDGPATRYGMPGISLVTPVTVNRTDGYVWGMMRNGRGLMPNYNRIEEMDRWDVVNYVRALQGRVAAPAQQVAARPGEGGNKVPGYTRFGPTVPAPYISPSNLGRLQMVNPNRQDTGPGSGPGGADTANPAVGQQGPGGAPTTSGAPVLLDSVGPQGGAGQGGGAPGAAPPGAASPGAGTPPDTTNARPSGAPGAGSPGTRPTGVTP